MPHYEQMGTPLRSVPHYEQMGTLLRSVPHYEQMGTLLRSVPDYEQAVAQAGSLRHDSLRELFVVYCGEFS